MDELNKKFLEALLKLAFGDEIVKTLEKLDEQSWLDLQAFIKSELGEKSYNVLLIRLGQDKTLEGTSRETGMGREEIRQLQVKAVRNIRASNISEKFLKL